jgi:hypothetical protein
LGEAFVEKDLSVDVDVTEFFILTVSLTCFGRQSDRRVIAGYFARYKQQPNHTLSVILVLPFARKRGYGELLLSVAFELDSLRVRGCGKPECCGAGPGKIDEPFSDLGCASIDRFFRRRLFERLPCHTALSGKQFVEKMLGVHPEDGFKFLVRLGALRRVGRSANFLVSIPKSAPLDHEPLYRVENFRGDICADLFHYGES